MTNTDPLTALSPLDGRYQQALLPLSKWWSESALIQHRLIVEAKWLVFLAQSQQLPELPPLSPEAQTALQNGLEHFSIETAKEVKSLEKTTNHDVKAIEYALKNHCETHPELAKVKEFIHFGCTSEDINNLAYGLMLKGARETVILPQLNTLLDKLVDIAHQTAETPLLARTHGQPATPTTVGKEMANFAYRLRQGMNDLKTAPIRGKFNGAVGNFNAHYFAYPEVDWCSLNQRFVEALGLVWNPYTTQIEPHDYIATLLHSLMRCNQMLIDLARDMWGYIAFGYFKQKTIEGEVGSSTMPHMVNPIDFENAEGNLGLSNALAHFLSQQLLTSRFQRDLVDSTLMRNIGTALGYASLAYQNLSKGLAKLSVNTAKINADLDGEWAVLAEPIQMVMRRYGLPSPYEQLKALTRGQPINQSILHTFIDESALPEPEKIRLKTLTPASYLGLATSLAKGIQPSQFKLRKIMTTANGQTRLSVYQKVIQRLSNWLMKEHPHQEMPLSDFDRLRYEIRPGDILLVAGRSRVSDTIRLITQSTWTHAMIYIGRLHDIEDHALREKVRQHHQGSETDQLVVESLLGKGTIVTPLARYRDYHIRICRPRGISLRGAQAVIGYTIDKIGVEYDVRQLLDLARFLYPWNILPRRWRSSLFRDKPSNTTRQICSSLLAEAFGSVHFPILPILHRDGEDRFHLVQRNPRLFTPSDFDFSPFFEIIKYPFFSLSEDGMYRHLPWSQTMISNDEAGIVQLNEDAKKRLAESFPSPNEKP